MNRIPALVRCRGAFPNGRKLRRIAIPAVLLIAGVSLPVATVAAVRAGSTRRPNIVFILADDLGWSDVGCYGSTFYNTPHIDRLASAGMRFTNAYAAGPVCSPTRASIITGKYPARLHLTDFIPGAFYPHEKLLPGRHVLHMALEEVTIAETLWAAGYQTGLVGKWHLGRQDEYHPARRGFDVVVDGAPGGIYSYFSPYRHPSLPDGPTGENLTDRLTLEAVKFIKQNKDRPFFLYLAYRAVHTTSRSRSRVQGKPAYVEKFRAKMKTDRSQKNATYAAMIQSLDDGVGQLVATLDELNLADHTVVVFFSDNGGYDKFTNNAPLRGGKGVLYEGGIREPLIVRWPGTVKPGSICDEPVSSVDFYPTLMNIAKAKGDPKHNQHLDGVDVAPLWHNSAAHLNREAIYWHFPHYYRALKSQPHSAIRRGHFKLLEFYGENRIELYDLKKDIGEQNNLASQMPKRANTLRNNLRSWLSRVDAEMPSPNPNYNRDKRYKDARSYYRLPNGSR